MNVFSNYSHLQVCILILTKANFNCELVNTEVLQRASIYFVQPVEKHPDQSP